MQLRQERKPQVGNESVTQWRDLAHSRRLLSPGVIRRQAIVHPQVKIDSRGKPTREPGVGRLWNPTESEGW